MRPHTTQYSLVFCVLRFCLRVPTGPVACAFAFGSARALALFGLPAGLALQDRSAFAVVANFTSGFSDSASDISASSAPSSSSEDIFCIEHIIVIHRLCVSIHVLHQLLDEVVISARTRGENTDSSWLELLREAAFDPLGLQLCEALDELRCVFSPEGASGSQDLDTVEEEIVELDEQTLALAAEGLREAPRCHHILACLDLLAPLLLHLHRGLLLWTVPS